MHYLPAAKIMRIAKKIHCFAMFSKKFTFVCDNCCIVSNFRQVGYEQGRSLHIFIAKLCAILHFITLLYMYFYYAHQINDAFSVPIKVRLISVPLRTIASHSDKSLFHSPRAQLEKLRVTPSFCK